MIELGRSTRVQSVGHLARRYLHEAIGCCPAPRRRAHLTEEGGLSYYSLRRERLDDASSELKRYLV